MSEARGGRAGLGGPLLQPQTLPRFSPAPTASRAPCHPCRAKSPLRPLPALRHACPRRARCQLTAGPRSAVSSWPNSNATCSAGWPCSWWPSLVQDRGQRGEEGHSAGFGAEKRRGCDPGSQQVPCVSPGAPSAGSLRPAQRTCACGCPAAGRACLLCFRLQNPSLTQVCESKPCPPQCPHLHRGAGIQGLVRSSQGVRTHGPL